ncbi:MAG: hypothetical protein U0163_08060 [Gemmatimonadaceae bacterium]
MQPRLVAVAASDRVAGKGGGGSAWIVGRKCSAIAIIISMYSRRMPW